MVHLFPANAQVVAAVDELESQNGHWTRASAITQKLIDAVYGVVGKEPPAASFSPGCHSELTLPKTPIHSAGGFSAEHTASVPRALGPGEEGTAVPAAIAALIQKLNAGRQSAAPHQTSAYVPG